MIPVFFQKLTGHRLLLVAMTGVIIAESILSAYSIALLIPLAQSAVSNGAPMTIPGLPKAVGDWLSSISPAWAFAIFGLFLVGKTAMTYGRSVAEAYLVLKLRVDWTIALCQHNIHLPMALANKQKQGEIINLLIREVVRACNYVTASVAYLANLACFIAVALIVAAADWRLLAGGGAVGLAFYFLLLRPLFRFSKTNGNTLVVMNRDLTSRIAETINAIKDVKILNMEAFRLKGIAGQTRRASRQEFYYSLIQDLPPNITELGFAIAILALAAFIGLSDGLPLREILPGLIFSFVAFYRLIGYLSNLAGQQVRITNRVSSFILVSDLARQQPDREDMTTGEPVANLNTDIELVGVEARYAGGPPIIQNLSVTIPKGKTVFLFGPSGAGKSTLLDLLTRLIDPAAGEIRANGRNIRDFSLSSWRRLFGYVSQEPFLFHGTVMENIKLGDAGIDEATVRWAIDTAGATDFVENMPNGYDTVIDEKGTNISGGQRRRLALARALARKPEVLILDEATSAVESSLERQIIQSLKGIPGLTTIAVTHREENYELADTIINLEAGRLRGAQTRAHQHPISTS